MTERQTCSDSCIVMGNFSSAWLKEATWGNNNNIAANATVIHSWWPHLTQVNGSSTLPQQPKLAPFCTGRQTEELTLPWTGYQSRDAAWAMEGLFSFSQNMGTNFTKFDTTQSDVNPFDQWLLCGINGSCTDFTPMTMIKGGRGEKGQLEFDWKGSFSSGSISWKADDIKYQSFMHTSYESIPVCVWPPFMWMDSN